MKGAAICLILLTVTFLLSHQLDSRKIDRQFSRITCLSLPVESSGFEGHSLHFDADGTGDDILFPEKKPKPERPMVQGSLFSAYLLLQADDILKAIWQPPKVS